MLILSNASIWILDIPKEIGALINLEHLNFFNNQITVNIFSFISTKFL